MKYKGIMSKGPADYSRALRKGALSDQDLFSEVFKHQHVLLPIKMVFFPSWMNHFDILPKYLTDFRRNKTHWKMPQWRELARECAHDFGAIHFSSAFSMTKPMSLEQQVESLRTGFRGHKTSFVILDWKVSHQTLVRDLFTPVLQACIHTHETTKTDIQLEILNGAQAQPLPQGWARALQVVTIDSTLLSRKLPSDTPKQSVCKKRRRVPCPGVDESPDFLGGCDTKNSVGCGTFFWTADALTWGEASNSPEPYSRVCLSTQRYHDSERFSSLYSAVEVFML